MRSNCAQGVLLSLGIVLASVASGQESPRLLPIPTEADFYLAAPAAHQDVVVVEAAPSDNPAILPSPSDVPLQPTPSYNNALQQWGSDSCTSGVCDNSQDCGCGRGYWFGSFGVLVLGSPTRSSTFLTSNDNTLLPVMQTGDSTGVFAGGIEVTAGRMFASGNWGTSFTYWGVYPAGQSTDAFNTTFPISSYLNFSGLDYNGNPGTTFWNNVVHQRVATSQAINSLEWNILGNCGGGAGLFAASPWQGCNCGPCAPRLGAGWMVGVRYFQFNDDFQYSSDNFDTLLDGSANEMQYQIRTRNNLLGFQVGGGLNYRVWNGFSLYGIGRSGIYGNHAIVEQAISGSAGDAVVNVGPNSGTAYRFSGSQTSLAFLGQLDMGGRYQLNDCWSFNLGYRMVGISGLALTEGQIPSNFAAVADAQRIQAGDGLILHGAYMGTTYCW